MDYVFMIYITSSWYSGTVVQYGSIIQKEIQLFSFLRFLSIAANIRFHMLMIS